MYTMTAHLINTLLLIGAATLTAWWASGGSVFQWQGRPLSERWFIGLALLGVLLVGASGAIIALGDTLFPAETLAHGLQQKADPEAHLAVRLRNLHPALAMLMGGYLIFVSNYFHKDRYSLLTRRLARTSFWVFVAQLALGGLNVLLLAPVWMQLVHLFVSALVWIMLVLLANSALSDPLGQGEAAVESKVART